MQAAEDGAGDDPPGGGPRKAGGRGAGHRTPAPGARWGRTGAADPPEATRAGGTPNAA